MITDKKQILIILILIILILILLILILIILILILLLVATYERGLWQKWTLKPRLHEQFICDNFYIAIFICSCRWTKYLYDNYICWNTGVLVCPIQKIVRVDETTSKTGNCFDVIHSSQTPFFRFQIKVARVDGAFTGK